MFGRDEVFVQVTWRLGGLGNRLVNVAVICILGVDQKDVLLLMFI